MKFSLVTPIHRSLRDHSTRVTSGVAPAFLPIPGAGLICKAGCNLIPAGVGRDACNIACGLL